MQKKQQQQQNLSYGLVYVLDSLEFLFLHDD